MAESVSDKIMEALFGDVRIASSRIAHLKWESKPLERTPTEGSVQFTWKDQGWGNTRGALFLMLMSEAGEEKASYTLTNRESPDEWEDVKVELVATDPVLTQATIGCWYQVRAEGTGHWGHELYVKDLVLRLADHVLQSTEDLFGDFTLTEDTNIKGTDVYSPPTSGTIQCTWKDQGWGNQEGKLYLKLMAPDGSEKVSYTVTEGLSPPEWEDINVELVATDAILAEATTGCWYQVMAVPGSGGGHKLYLKGLVLRLSDHFVPSTKDSFGDFFLANDTNIKGTAVDYTPASGTVQCSWKNQGWGDQKGKLYLKLIAPDGSERASFDVTEGFSPHTWEDITADLVATDAVLAEATAGCWYQITAVVGSGGGHKLYLKDLVLRVAGAPPGETELSSGGVHISDTNARLKWKGGDLQFTPISGSIRGRWKDQGWGTSAGKLYLNLMAPDGSEKASFTVTEGLSPHEWEDIRVDVVATDAVLAEATVGCWYQVMVDCGGEYRHELSVEGLVLQLTGENPPSS